MATIDTVEIFVIARAEADLAVVLDRFGAEAVQLQIVDPSWADWQHFGAEQEHGLDEVGGELAVWH